MAGSIFSPLQRPRPEQFKSLGKFWRRLPDFGKIPGFHPL